MMIFKDAYLWSGVALLAASFGGVFWIIRSLQKKQESENALPGGYADIFTPPQPKQAAPPPPAATAPETPGITLESVGIRLERIEDDLRKIAQKLDQPSPGLSEEIKTLLQNAKTQPAANGRSEAVQISELTAKIEKIYQVLASISGSSR